MQNEENQEGATSQNTEVATEETTEATVDTDTTDWKAEALKQKAINDRLSKKLSSGTITKKDNPSQESSRETLKPSDILRADEFKLYRQGYTETEIDLIMKNGGMETLKDDKSPLVLGLKVAHEQRRAEEAASKATDTSGASELERKYTKADLEKMKPSELEGLIGFAS